MSSYKPMEDGDKPAFSHKMFACPLKGHWISFQLVDEFGDGKPYAGLAYTLQDSAEQQYTGVLDAEGFAKIEDCYRGPLLLHLDAAYAGTEDSYLMRISQRQDPSTWLAEQLSQAQQWGWSAPEQLHFLTINKLNETELPIIKNWLPHAGEAPQVHSERLFDEVKLWSGEQSA